MSIVDLNNDIKQLVIDEKREIERILKVISEKSLEMLIAYFITVKSWLNWILLLLRQN